MASNEVIDLTASDDHEVIVLSDDDEDTANVPKPRTSRKPKFTEDNEEGLIWTVDEPAQQAANKHIRENETTGAYNSQEPQRKEKKPRRKKKRKQVIVGDAEDGEIIEIEMTEDSAQVSREQSRERTGKDNNRRGGRGDPEILVEDEELPPKSLLSRLQMQEGSSRDPPSTSETPKDSKVSRKREKKRKRRENGLEQEGASSSRPRSRTPSPKRDAAPDTALFFLDDTPAEVAANLKPPRFEVHKGAAEVVTEKPNKEEPMLLLPAHVSVFGEEGQVPMEIIAPLPVDSDDEDYIEYLDYDDDRAPGVVRYFDNLAEIEEAKAAKATRIVCKKCGAEGEHRTYECPIIICLTCGARDEHSTRSCPISKTCFSCGMKGHINRTCPNRYSSRANGGNNDCDRCGSRLHNTNECPTLWRIYNYVGDDERLAILSAREQKRELAIGEGGEGYIAPEDWCYNCGGCGHLGDDCSGVPHPYDFPQEPSAFSEYNTRSGPFFDTARPEKSQRAPSKAARYASRAKEAWGDGYGFVMPLDVGKQGKDKQRARMEKHARELQDDDDQEDWFAKRGGGRSNNRNGGGDRDRRGDDSRHRPSESKKISFGDLKSRIEKEDKYKHRRRESGGGRSYHDDLPQPTRETDSLRIKGASRRGGDRIDTNDRDDRRRKDRHRNRSREGRRDHDSRGVSPRREPRYRGGYSR